jgi:general secretion pathway protein C
MRLSLDPRARRLWRRVPRADAATLAELALLALLAFQCARLIWIATTPVGPFGAWRAPADPLASADPSILARFDPFFRLAPPEGPAAVTSLDLKLFGVRQDQASGRGSAIIATPDGVQKSFAVGDEIVPGVKLVSVEFDHVTISRGGSSEQLFLEQPAAGEAPPSPSPSLALTPRLSPTSQVIAPPPGATAPPRRNSFEDIRSVPRMNRGSVTGLQVFPQGSGDGFRASGLAPGDVVVAVNGRQVGSGADVGTLVTPLGARSVELQVERDGRLITLRPGGRP